MPSFKKDIEVEIDFEVFCRTCGAGLCGNTTTRYSRSRGEPQIVVDVCDVCIKQKDDEIDELKDRISQLEEELEKQLEKSTTSNYTHGT